MVLLQRPSHYLLSYDVHEALDRASSVHILLSHLYDESLVYMAMNTGMKLCDIMYAPCDVADWLTSKCNSTTNVVMSDEDRLTLKSESERTGEAEFYSTLVADTEAKLTTREVREMTTTYRRLREKAVTHCEREGVVKSVVKMLRNHPQVTRGSGKKGKLFFFQNERMRALNPLTICLG